MDIEDHIPQSVEPSFQEIVSAMIENQQYAECGAYITNELHATFAEYSNDPALFGLLHIANNVVVGHEEGNKVMFLTKAKTMRVPHRIVHECESIFDLITLMLVERARIVINRTAHKSIIIRMGRSEDVKKEALHLAREVYAHAVARCHIASIIIEKMYIGDVNSVLMHGFDIEAAVGILVEVGWNNTAEIFPTLYAMVGQEMYHAMLNRQPLCDNIIEFAALYEAILTDMNKNNNKNNGGGNLDPSDASNLVEDDNDNLLKNIQERVMIHNNSDMEDVPVDDLDPDQPLDRYIQDIIISGIGESHSSRFRNEVVSKQVEATYMNVMRAMQAQERDIVCGSMEVPERPTVSDLMSHIQGYTPMVWQDVRSPAVQKTEGYKYHVYFDVSGSMTRWHNYVRGLTNTIKRYVAPDGLHQFSTEVCRLEITRPYLRSTGGTIISSAFKHAQSNKVKSMILITDMECWSHIDTKGIDHVIIVVTDTKDDATAKIMKNRWTVDSNTKVDIIYVKYDDLIQQTDGRTHF